MFFVLGYFTYPILSQIFNSNSSINEKNDVDENLIENDEIEIKRLKVKKYNLEPKYHGYLGGYDLITKCNDCNMIALYEDQHPAKPCNFCGGIVTPNGAGKWMEINGKMQWNKRLKK